MCIHTGACVVEVNTYICNASYGMYVCMYVCMYVYMYVHLYIANYVYIRARDCFDLKT